MVAVAGWFAAWPVAGFAQGAPAGGAAPAPAVQKTPIIYTPQVPLPGDSEEARALQSAKPVSENLLGQYIVTIYRFGMWLAITLAIFMTMVGGFLWTIAGGNPSRVENAKSYITAALTGLIVALTSYLILQTVNPDLVIIRSLKEVQRFTNLAAAPSPTTLAGSNYGCPSGLVVKSPDNECEQACQKATGKGAMPSKDSSLPYAPPIPPDGSGKYCCACASQACLYEAEPCALAGGSSCCRPLVCNLDPDTCQPRHKGSLAYSEATACEPPMDDNCLSGLCFDILDSAYDYCVPETKFPENHECNRTEECQLGMRCVLLRAKRGPGDPRWYSPLTTEYYGYCVTPRKRGQPCQANGMCESGLCEGEIQQGGDRGNCR